jgi:hypothetical protein
LAYAPSDTSSEISILSWVGCSVFVMAYFLQR